VPQLIDELDHAEPYHRWTAALALVRILGPGSRSYLDGRAEDAGDAVERCAMYAAQIRAGDHGKVRSLHEALQATALISVLRPVWKLEILDALRAPGDLDPRAFSLWRAAAGVGTRQLQYFDALSPPIADASAQTRSAPAPGAAPSRTTVFISYSRRDGDWLKRFQRMLSPLVRSNRIELWDDTAIQPGKWHPQIKAAMSQADVALFLVSEHFLASDFIMQNELPDLLQFAENGNVKILWVLVDDCLWEASALAGYQGENPEHPLSLLSGGEQTRVIKNACVKISSLMKKE
jgi:hypothetical protein